MNYITTTLPYINSRAHIGHALELVQADVLYRYFKDQDNEIVFNSGLDEHGSKVYNSAIEKGLSPQEHCDLLAKEWEDFYDLLDIKPTTFYRTTSVDHFYGVRKIWDKCLDKGDIYKKNYKGSYCVGCEEFKSDNQIIDGHCGNHPYLDLEETEEENYFFRLSNYKEYLLEWLDNNPSFIKPDKKTNELRNQIVDIEDISISRLKTSVPWGIPVPGDPNQTIYVWFDALCNYILSAGYGTVDFKWENTIQLCGPDNLRFQGIIFQAILKSLNIEQTTHLLVHGTVVDRKGIKISKSLGNVIDPVEQIEKFNLEAVRYYLVAGLPTFSNCKYDEEELKSFHNSHLGNLGNLIKRVNTLIKKKNVDLDKSKVHHFRETKNSVDSLFENFKINDAYKSLYGIIQFINNDLATQEPWKLSDEEAYPILNEAYWNILNIIPYYEYIVPSKYQEIYDTVINIDSDKILFERL